MGEAEDRVAIAELLHKLGAPASDVAAAVRITENMQRGIHAALQNQWTIKFLVGLNIAFTLSLLMAQLADVWA